MAKKVNKKVPKGEVKKAPKKELKQPGKEAVKKKLPKETAKTVVKAPIKEAKKPRPIFPLIIIVSLIIIVIFFFMNLDKINMPSIEKIVKKGEAPQTPVEEQITEEEVIVVEEPGEIEEQPEEVTIQITNSEYVPPTATIKKGTTVTWVNMDRGPHGISARDKTFYQSRLTHGQEYSYTFNEAGTWEYFDVIYITRKGTIIVE